MIVNIRSQSIGYITIYNYLIRNITVKTALLIFLELNSKCSLSTVDITVQFTLLLSYGH